jgi:hypothetical protein
MRCTATVILAMIRQLLWKGGWADAVSGGIMRYTLLVEGEDVVWWIWRGGMPGWMHAGVAHIQDTTWAYGRMQLFMSARWRGCTAISNEPATCSFCVVYVIAVLLEGAHCDACWRSVLAAGVTACKVCCVSRGSAAQLGDGAGRQVQLQV